MAFDSEEERESHGKGSKQIDFASWMSFKFYLASSTAQPFR